MEKSKKSEKDYVLKVENKDNEKLDNNEVYIKPEIIEYDSPSVSFTTMWDKSTS